MTKYTLFTLFLALAIVNAGCASDPSRPAGSDTAKEVHNALDSGFAPDTVRTAGSRAPQPPVSTRLNLEPPSQPVSTPSRAPEQDRFDLAVENGPVREVLMSLVKGTRQNMIVHPSVQGNVSLSLKAVTVEDVLEALRSVYGYEFRRTAIGYEVLVSDMQTRLFKVDYLNVKRSGESQVRVSSGQLTESGNTGNGHNSTQNSQQNNKRNNKPGQALSGSEVNTRSVSDFWQDLSTSLAAIVGEESGHKVVVNSQTGIVLVRATPSELRYVEDYLNTIQGTIARQVILEAKIVEVELSDGFQAGINWAAFARSGSNAANIGQIGGGSVFNGDGYSDIAGDSFNLSNLNGAEGLTSSAFGGVFTMAVATTDFTAFIEALEKQGDVHVLSSPRVSTVNNQKAVIKVGTDEFFVTGIETDTTQANNTFNTSINVELTPFFSGVALDVIPQIDSRGEVTLHIHPSVSDVNEKTKEIQVSSGEDGILKVPLALSTIRESDSIIRARSGQVVVIGGLMQTIMQDNDAGVPYLSRLPFLGGLFRHRKQVSVKSELVILLRPVIVDDHGVWDDYMAFTRSQFDRLTHYPTASAEADDTEKQ